MTLTFIRWPVNALGRYLLACVIATLSGPAIAQPVTEGEALISLALERRDRGEYALALEAGTEALRRARATGNRRLAAEAHNILGLTENSRDQPAAALRHGLDELRIREELGDRHGLSQSLNNIGISYRRLGEYEEALEYHRRSLAMKLELGDRDGAGFSHHNIGEVLADQDKHEEALESFVRAEAEWRAVDNRRALAAALKSQGQALASLDRPGQSIQKLNASLALRDDPPNPHGKAETLLILCRVQLLMERPAEALENCRSALSIAESLDQTTIIGDALSGLAAAEAASGNVPAAGSLLEKQLTLQRRMREQEQSRLRSEMRATLEAHEAEHHAERLENEAALREQALGRRAAERNMALIAALLLLVIAGIAVNRFRLKRESEQRFRRLAEELSLALGQVKTLRGLLPLCAWCHRKVRDDDGNWIRFENFVLRHTEAEVTHGICPDCKETTFPKSTGGPEGAQ